MLSILLEWEEQPEEATSNILVQREYDEMQKDTFDVLVTHIASHSLLLEKEADEIVMVEVKEEVEEIIVDAQFCSGYFSF